MVPPDFSTIVCAFIPPTAGGAPPGAGLGNETNERINYYARATGTPGRGRGVAGTEAGTRAGGLCARVPGCAASAYGIIYHRRYPPSPRPSQPARATEHAASTVRFPYSVTVRQPPPGYPGRAWFSPLSYGYCPRAPAEWTGVVPSHSSLTYSCHAVTDSCCGTENVRGPSPRYACIGPSVAQPTGDDARETTHARARERESVGLGGLGLLGRGAAASEHGAQP